MNNNPEFKQALAGIYRDAVKKFKHKIRYAPSILSSSQYDAS